MDKPKAKKMKLHRRVPRVRLLCGVENNEDENA